MKISIRVRNILGYSQQARNSDKELLIEYMQAVGMNLSPGQVDKFRDMPAFETITRVRRKLQAEGKYPASKAVQQERNFMSYTVQQRAPKTSGDKMEYILTPPPKAVAWQDVKDRKK